MELKDIERSLRKENTWVKFDLGSKEGINEKPSVPKCSEGL